MKICNKSIIFFSLVLFLTSCNFSKSIHKDLQTTLLIKGDGLSADNVFISVKDKKVTSNTFSYGENIYTNFENLDGFTVENGLYYPIMNVAVISKKGDTVLNYKDLYSGKGVDISTKTLMGNLIMANPVQSNEEYTINYTIKDKKGEGSFSSTMECKIEADPSIEILKNGLDFDENYIFSQKRKEVITDNTAGFNETILLFFQGLRGYTLKDTKAEIGLKVKVTNSNGAVVVENPDVFANQRIDENILKSGISSTLIMNKSDLANPCTWQVEIWDKNSDAKLSAKTKISFKD